MHPNHPSRLEQAEAISAEIASIHWNSHEFEIERVETVIGDGLVAAMWRFELLPAELVVIGAGGSDAVLRFHHESERTIESALRAAVERATGRTVLSFCTETDVDEGVGLELFVMAPPAEAAGDPRG